MNTLGTTTARLFVKTQSHKLSHAFTAAEAIKKSQPVKLKADGELEVLDLDDASRLCIGYALHDAADGEQVTVVLKGYAIVRATSGEAMNPGPCRVKGYDATNGRATYQDTGVTDALFDAWNLTVAGGADVAIDVILR